MEGGEGAGVEEVREGRRSAALGNRVGCMRVQEWKKESWDQEKSGIGGRGRGWKLRDSKENINSWSIL